MNKKIGLATISILVALIAGIGIGQVMFPSKNIYLTVNEAISIEPESVSVTLYVGESGTADFTIHNVADVDIPLTVYAEVTAFPEGGSPTDVTLAYPAEITAISNGDTTLTVEFTLATGSFAGEYTITVIPTRI